ncbi:MAG: alcohol dehydrogenase catalytic domain-containing protein [Chloroflexi bacterium]|nr:alcohol dehydrogenase catalytic domain-containing protein [Chloroflexota bacterium]
MSDKLTEYRQAETPLPDENRLWYLYGAGFESLGRDGKPEAVLMPEYGPNELLVRHDACGHCFSDIKVIRLGEDHPRIGRDMKKEPVVLGHEVSMTVVGVGANLVDQYSVGDRFIIQAEINVQGFNMAYGYRLQGGLSQFNVLDHRVLDGDDGCYLIPLKPGTGYAESALVEPWACVIAAYKLVYRSGLKDGGTAWVVGTDVNDELPYTISAGFDSASHPDSLILTQVPPRFAAWLRERAEELGVAVMETDDASVVPDESIDDIILLGADPDLVEQYSPKLADFGVFALVASESLSRKVSLDVGRIHYNRWVYIGGPGPDIARVYGDLPVRSRLKTGGTALFVGAGGPMGRMHVQHAIEVEDGPAVVVCSDVSDERLADLCASFAKQAAEKGIEFICVNPMNKDTYPAQMDALNDPGFDDIVVLAPIARVIADSATLLAPQGVMNVFAGVARGTMAEIDLSDVYLRDTRVIGHSASAIEDMLTMLREAEAGRLSPNRSVAAIGSLEAAWDGLHAVHDAAYPGKIVIYPHIKELPLTSLAELKERLPSVYAKLYEGREWTNEAEAELLRVMLP